MSLNTTVKSHTNVELLKLNIKVLNGGDQHYVPGQTMTYSFFTSSNTSIFNNYKAAFGVNVSHDPNIWNTSPNWVVDVDQTMAGINEIINLTITKTADFFASDIRWTGVVDPSNSGIAGFSFLTPSDDMDGQGDGNDAGILLYTVSSHIGEDANYEKGGSNERTATILHEFGHFLGLSHPHTNAPSDAPFAELNDNKYDLLSYEYSDKNRKVIKFDTGNGGSTTSTTSSFGKFVNFTPINIAQLHYLYGANTETHKAGTSYTLTDAATVARDLDGSDGTISVGRAYYSIWDNGGEDEIIYNGADRALLNLNAATINRTVNDADLVETLGRVQNSDYYDTLVPDYRNEITDSKYYAGGFFSQILTNNDDVYLFDNPNFGTKYANTLGGYVIANGVVIENATGGNGNDLIIGNAANNILSGNGGNDTIFDGNGHDTIIGGSGKDTLFVGKGNDSFDGESGSDLADFASVIGDYQIYVVGNNAIIQDIGGIKYGSNSFTDVENFTFSGVDFALAALPVTGEYERLYADQLNNEFVADAGGIDGTTNDTFWGTTSADNFVGELLNDRYEGNTGTDKITIDGNYADFTFTTGDGSEFVITKNSDATQFDVLHSVEQITFDDQAITILAINLGLSAGDFTTWQADYDFG